MNELGPLIVSPDFESQIHSESLCHLWSQKEGRYLVFEEGGIVYRGSGYLDIWGFCVKKKNTLYPVQYPSKAAIGCYARPHSNGWLLTELGEAILELKRETGIFRFTLLQNRVLAEITKKYRCERRGEILSMGKVSTRKIPHKIARMLACAHEIAQLVFDPRFGQKMKKEPV